MTRIAVLAAACLLLFAITAHGQTSTASISGQILGAGDKPLAGVKLTLLSAGGPGGKAPAPTTSGPEGKYSFTGLDAGQYAMRTEQEGYIPSFTAVRQGKTVLSGATILTLTAGQVMDDYTLGLIPESVLTGTVTGEDGAPLSRVQIRAYRQVFNGNAPTASATSDDKGQFRLDGLAAGRYYLYYLTPSDYPTYPSAYFPDKVNTSDATGFDVTEGQVRANVEIRLHKVPLVHVRGKIQNQLNPDAHFQILYTRVTTDNLGGGADPLIGAVKPDGTFDLSGVAQGSWSLGLMSVHGLAKLAGGTTVNVKGADVSDVVLTAKPTIEIKGTVRVVPDGPLPPMLQVLLRPSGAGGVSGQLPRTVVGADGSFTLSGVAPVRYTLLAGIQRGYLKSAMFGDQDVTHSELDASGAGGAVQLVVGMDGGEIGGTVTGADGKPAGNAALTIAPDPDIPDRTDLYRSTRARPDGQFTVPGLPPGKYRVFAADPLNSTFNIVPESLRKFESAAVRVTLEPGGKVQTTVQEIPNVPAAK